MSLSDNERAEQHRRRWTRENAHLYIRPDAARFLRPDAQRFLRPDSKGWSQPEKRLFDLLFCNRALRAEGVRGEQGAQAGQRAAPWSYASGSVATVGANATSKAAQPSARTVLRLKSELAGLRRQLAVIQREIVARRARGLPPLRESDPCWQDLLGDYRRFHGLCRKAGFDHNQPRVPAGNPDGGQWTDGGGTSDTVAGGGTGGGTTDGRILSDAAPDNEWKPGAQYASNSAGKRPPEPPKIPKERPPTARLRNQVIKEVAKWLVKVGARELTGPVGTALNIAEAGLWFYEEAVPYIRAYIDAPKTLDDLQDAVRTPSKGYDIHHIVEQTPAEQDGYSRSMIDAPDNLVRIPTLKHWEINSWYMTKNEDYGGLPPRVYLRGKSWEERRQIGLKALLQSGVLKP